VVAVGVGVALTNMHDEPALVSDGKETFRNDQMNNEVKVQQVKVTP